MILHLTPGSGSVELHFHDDAQVALYQLGGQVTPRQIAPSPAIPHPSRSGPRWFLLGLTGAVCLTFGYGFAVRGSVPQVQVHPMGLLPGNLPLVPVPPPLPESEAAVAIPPVWPRAEATPTDGVPSALARQLVQAPVVVPPMAPARPAAGSSAFGLEN